MHLELTSIKRVTVTNSLSLGRASMFTHVNGNVCVYAINIYKNGLPFKQILAHDKLHGL